MYHSERARSHWKLLLGLSVLLLQLTAAAQSQTPAQACLRKARQLYDSLQYERALKALQCVPSGVLTQDERISILLFKGIFLAELLRQEEASAAFKEALLLQPGALLPLDVSPKISLQFEAVRAALAVAKPQTEKPTTRPGSQKELRPPPPPPEQPQKALVEVQSVQQPLIYVAPVTQQKVEVHNQPATPAVRAEEVHTSRVLDSHILIPAGAGGALAIAGGVFWGLARKEFSRIESNDPRLGSLSELQTSASHGRTYQTVGFSLMGAGLVGLGLAAGLYGMDRTDSPAELSVGLNSNQVVLSGRWW
jgi:tetratricopeptide (TPR) repeat protein